MIRNSGELEIIENVPELQTLSEQPRYVPVANVEVPTSQPAPVPPSPPQTEERKEEEPSPKLEEDVLEEKEESQSLTSEPEELEAVPEAKEDSPDQEPEEFETVLKEESQEYSDESSSSINEVQEYERDYYSKQEEEENEDLSSSEDLFPKSSGGSFIDDFYLDSDAAEPENSGVLPVDEEGEEESSAELYEEGLEEIEPEHVPKIISAIEERKSELEETKDISADEPSTEELKKKEPVEPLSPREIWHRLLVDAEESLKKSNLKSYMTEGEPLSFEGSQLTVVFDGEYESEHVKIINQNMNILNKRLQSITRDYSASIKIKQEKAIHELHDKTRLQDVDEVRKRVEQNEFIRETMDIFDGTIVDIHG
jgi:hypothetical protein